MNRLAMLNEGYARDSRQKDLALKLADKEAQRQKEHDDRTNAAEKERATQRTNEQLRLEKERDAQAESMLVESLANTYIGTESPVTGQPTTPGEAWQRAHSKVQQLKSLQGLIVPSAQGQRAVSAANLGVESDTGALPYASNRAATDAQAAIASNFLKRQLAEQGIAETAARLPYVGDLSRSGALADIADNKRREAVAGVDTETASGTMPWARRLSENMASFKAQKLGYDIGDLPAEHEAHMADIAEKTAVSNLFTQNPEQSIKGLSAAAIRAQGALDLQKLKQGGIGNPFGSSPGITPRPLTREELMQRAAERAAQSGAITNTPPPRNLRSLTNIISNLSNPFPATNPNLR